MATKDFIPNVDTAWEKFQQRIESIQRENTLLLASKERGGIGGTESEELHELLSGETEDKEFSWVIWLDQTPEGTFIVLELQAKSEKYQDQCVKIHFPTVIASIGKEEYEVLGIEWEKDPPINIPSTSIAKGKATQTTLGMIKKPLSEYSRQQLIKFLQPINLTFSE